MNNLTKDIIASLSPEKRELLLQRLNKKKGDTVSKKIPQRKSTSDSFPLSFAQQRLWFLDQLEPGNSAYHLLAASRLLGPLALQDLQQSLQALVVRHESLRTTFPSVAGAPVQRIWPRMEVTLPLIDLRGLTAAHREAEVTVLLQQEAERPFDLQHGPLLRWHLVRLDAQDHLLLLSMHHIISDGWSMGLLLSEFITLYTAAQQKQAPSLPTLPLQYADYALWQRQWLQGEVLQRQLTYWQTALADLAPLELPIDAARPPVQRFRGARLSALIPEKLTRELRTFSVHEGATLFMTLLASFLVLLARSSGQDDLAVGTPIANRTRQETEALIGCFVNTLVLRTDLSGDPSFVEVLGRVRRVALEAYSHQDLPFEQVVEAVHPQRDLSRSPLFQVFFSMYTPGPGPVLPAGLQVREVAIDAPTAKFELSLLLTEQEHDLGVTLEYNTDLFTETSMQRLLTHWLLLVPTLLAEPRRPITCMPLLADAERAVLERWNATESALPVRTVAQAFAQQVQRTPDAVALIFQEQQMTYAALDAQTTQVAGLLRSLGAGVETLVGLLLPRSPWQLIAQLAVLKTGGAYLPLEPDFPMARLASLLTDARPAVLLTLQTLQVPPVEHAMQVLYLDASATGARLRTYSDQVPGSVPQPAALAYVIYTSGSTGIPKGVMISQEALLNCLHAFAPALAGQDPAIVPALTTLAFDIAALELLLPLVQGGRVLLVEREEAQDGQRLRQVVQEYAATCMQATPATWRLLRAAGWQGQLGQRLLCGGEAVARELAEDLLAGGAELWNVYGPTETTIWSTTATLQPGGRQVSIGTPIANTQVYVLDGAGQLVLPGVVGELYIGGLGLARGYWQRPEWTAERFVPDPFSGQGGSRLYKTGDLVRYDLEGGLEYLGRGDHQVKLRGYRIEVGEIEAVLTEQEEVQQSVVLLKEREGIGKHLVAYVVSQSQTRGAREWRAALQERVPDYMVPAVFVRLQALPLTANGKVDRSQLQRREEREEVEEQAERPVGGQVEELVWQVWQEVLQREEVGERENFFEIGGHSLLATQVVARVRKVLGVEIGLRAFFEEPTIAGVAAEARRQLRQEEGALPALVRVSRQEGLPLSFAQQRLWFLYQMDPHSAAYSIPVAVQLQGSLHRVALEHALRDVIRRHEILRTTFPSQEGEPVQCIAAEPESQLLFVDLSGLVPEQRELVAQRLAQQEAEQPFDLARGPLLRAQLLLLSAQEHIQLLTMHHIISDGWSMGVLVRELSSLYQSYQVDAESSLAPLPIQYADYAYWQRQCLQGDALKEEIRYWTRQLSGAQALELPGDYPRTDTLSDQGNRYEFQIDADLTQALKHLSRQEGVTLFMLLLASFQVLLSRLSGQQDVIVGTDSANRSQLETEGLIGFFVNLLSLRAHVRSEQSFRDFLCEVRETVLGAYMHQDFPFEMVIEHLFLDREDHRTPLVNILMVMQNVPLSNAALSDLTITPVSTSTTSAKFDLALFVTEDQAGLDCSVNYSTDLFKEATVEQFMYCYITLIRNIVARPEAAIENLEITTQEEKQLQTAHKEKHLRRQLDKLKDHKKKLANLS